MKEPPLPTPRQSMRSATEARCSVKPPPSPPSVIPTPSIELHTSIRWPVASPPRLLTNTLWGLQGCFSCSRPQWLDVCFIFIFLYSMHFPLPFLHHCGASCLFGPSPPLVCVAASRILSEFGPGTSPYSSSEHRSQVLDILSGSISRQLILKVLSLLADSRSAWCF